MRGYRLALLLLGLVMVAVAAWGTKEHQGRRYLELELNNRYQQTFYDLLTHVQNVEVLLGKCLVAGGRQQAVGLLSSVWQQAMMAQADLSSLPVSPQYTERTAKFLSQVADYANTLCRQAGTGSPLTEENWETLRRLYQQASSLNRELHRVEAEILARGPNFWELGRRLKARQARTAEAPASPFRALNRETQNYPTLVYDGPFSDHLEKQKPEGLTGPPVDRGRAEARARELVEPKPTRVRVTGEVKGRIPAYRVEADTAAGKVVALLTRQGGHLLLLLAERHPGKPRLKVEEARGRAEGYLRDKLGLKNMRLSYSVQKGALAIFNFIPEEGGVALYPDMVKVTVALDDGRVVGVDSYSYLMFHRPRSLPQPRLTAAEARGLLNPRLKVENQRLALIPTDGGKEKLCYEFKARLGEDIYLIYLDAERGEEEKILKLVPTTGGELAL
ncbi:germination protein YpeB [Ammonifex thiophilus]|uniref:Germination protein YpeB n=1 Tax=Ammonifex thiophilus TaxID=444093 RepID=A0A3D8P768_9THEO|nr:germination protein YpeB [Ammonifex thiophilus]RDV84547.1 germination protein YpeB [Ammonifex thiophilus]